MNQRSWIGIDKAAAILGVPELTLRRALERNAHRASGGGVVAATDGVRGRKFGRRWRVTLDAAWLEPVDRTDAK